MPKSKFQNLTAAEVVNSSSEKDLADIFFKYGEERKSRQIAKAIVEERRRKRITTTGELASVIQKVYPKRIGKINPVTKVFQALRIYVNRELDNLETLLKNLDKIVNVKGRIAIISFHSLEDRLVKNYFRALQKQGMVTILTKKPIIASRGEILENPRARSAKLRACYIISIRQPAEKKL